MRVTLFGGDLVTGEITVRNIPASSATCTQDLGAGKVELTVPVPMRDPLTGATTQIRSLLIPGRSFIGFDFGGTIIEAGPVWVGDLDLDAGNLTLRGAGLRSYFDHRFVMPLLGEGELPKDVTSTWATSLRTIAKRIVQQAQTWSPALPIVFEDDVIGDNVRTYPGSDLMRVGDALSNLEGVINGPDVAFRAEYKDASHVQWRLVTGDPLLSQSGADHVWNAAVPGASVKGVSVTQDATVLSGQHFATGSEQDSGALEAVAQDSTLADAGYPLFESSSSHNSVINLPVLQGHADAAVDTGKYLLDTWQFNARRAPVDDRGNRAGPWLGDYRAGDFARLLVNSPVVGSPGRMRLMSLTAGLDEWVGLKFAPERVGA